MHEAVIKIGALSAVRNLPTDPGLLGTLMAKSGTGIIPLEAKDLRVTLSRGGVACAQRRIPRPSTRDRGRNQRLRQKYPVEGGSFQTMT